MHELAHGLGDGLAEAMSSDFGPDTQISSGFIKQITELWHVLGKQFGK